VADVFFLKRTTFLNQYMPSFIRVPVGVVTLVISGYLASTGLSIVFGEKRDKPGVNALGSADFISKIIQAFT
jgi:hypothetical protein